MVARPTPRASAVAPHVGAWIEIFIVCLLNPSGPSLPTWERGLKSFASLGNTFHISVAPHVGAWIEISTSGRNDRAEVVAPHVGAWIEIPDD